MSISVQQQKPSILFTAFEPSGDSHAAPIIAALKQHYPDLNIYAWGGPKMEAAGAAIIERSAEDGSMGLGAITKAGAIRKSIKHIKAWSKQYRVVVHVPVDSPAANFPICKLLRKSGSRTVHLVAPQLWAWGAWRTKKLRRNTDLVLCLLPFEEVWFNERNIPAKFIGHPAINRPIDAAALQHTATTLPKGAPKLAIFPGSRSQEIKRNIGLMLATYRELQARHAELCGIIVCARKEILSYIKDKHDVMPTGLHCVLIDADVAVQWCDCALTVSGTMSLDITRQARPMVGVYKVGPVSRALGAIVLRTKYRLLPNIIAASEIVPEFVPHMGSEQPIVLATSPILADTKVAARQRAALEQVRAQFDGKNPGEEAAQFIAAVVRGER